MSSLLERLDKHKENRGLMANLRCVLVANKKHRAWPVLHRLGVPLDKKIPSFIAGLFATHPQNTSKESNFGDTCKAIQKARKERPGDDSKLTPTERRFQHLLAAERTELPDRVLRLVIMAKSENIPINYTKLQTDMKYWGDRGKQKWASAFWTQEGDSKKGDRP